MESPSTTLSALTPCPPTTQTAPPSLFAAHYAYTLAAFGSVSALTGRDKRGMYAALRLTPPDRHTRLFFPQLGLTAAEFATYQLLLPSASASGGSANTSAASASSSSVSTANSNAKKSQSTATTTTTKTRNNAKKKAASAAVSAGSNQAPATVPESALKTPET